MPRVGNKRNLCILKEPVQLQDGAGGIVDGWQDFAKIWASITPISGKESWANNQKYFEATHKIYTRYIPGVNTKMRIVCKGREMEILSVLNVSERDRELLIIAKEMQ